LRQRFQCKCRITNYRKLLWYYNCTCTNILIVLYHSTYRLTYCLVFIYFITSVSKLLLIIYNGIICKTVGYVCLHVLCNFLPWCLFVTYISMYLEFSSNSMIYIWNERFLTAWELFSITLLSFKINCFMLCEPETCEYYL